MKIYEYGDVTAKNVLVQAVDDHDLEGIENEVAVIGELCGKDFRLIAVKADNWNDDLSPWSAPAVFGEADFGGGASATLESILELCADKSKSYYIGGYSLSGLFALWAAYRTDIFRGVAAASPSVWFPGFSDHAKECAIRSDTVYLSLGDKEEKSRNPIMATVGDNIREIYGFLRDKGVNCTLEMNEGGHFKDADVRTAKAFA